MVNDMRDYSFDVDVLEAVAAHMVCESEGSEVLARENVKAAGGGYNWALGGGGLIYNEEITAAGFECLEEYARACDAAALEFLSDDAKTAGGFRIYRGGALSNHFRFSTAYAVALYFEMFNPFKWGARQLADVVKFININAFSMCITGAGLSLKGLGIAIK